MLNDFQLPRYSFFSEERRVLITGAAGQLGQELSHFYGERAWALTREHFDLSVTEALPELLNRHKPVAVINTAAYTQVDLAEKETALAHRVNALAPTIIARWCASNQVPFIHFSTDYVFNGKGDDSFTENDFTDPINAYGQSKLEGEKAIITVGGRYLIFRTSWVYNELGKNFFRTILQLGKEREVLCVVNDQYGAPTYAQHLALAAIIALEKSLCMPAFPSGIYHLCNGGVTTWHAFAETITDLARKNGIALRVQQIEGIASGDYLTAAKRPLNSRLDASKAERVFGIKMPSWQEGLRDCMNQLLAKQCP